jgi:hypothetical protein
MTDLEERKEEEAVTEKLVPSAVNALAAVRVAAAPEDPVVREELPSQLTGAPVEIPGSSQVSTVY